MDQDVNFWGHYLPLPPVSAPVSAGSGGGNLHLEGHLATTETRQTITSRKKVKCTPPRIEALLRRYNKEGTTNWKDILERLGREDPPISIIRSTLGKYLKECRLGTSRRNTMDEDDMRQAVLSELQKPQSEKRGVRNVWKCLKEDGNHIKRDFVEKIMKEVNPEGFVKRAPKRKSAPSKDTVSPVSVSPPAVQATYSGVLEAFPSHPSPFSWLEQSPSITQTQELDSIVHFPFSTETVPYKTQGSAPPANVSPQLCHGGFQEADTVMEDSECHSGHDPSGQTTEHNSRGTGQTFQLPKNADSVRAHERERTDHIEASTAADRSGTDSHADSSVPQALDSFIPREVAEPSQREDERSRLGVRTPNPGFWSAMSKASDEEWVTQILRLKLKNAVEDLCPHLGNWISTQILNESSVLHDLPVSTTQGDSGSPHDIRINHDNLDRRYVPDYNIPEDQVTKDALSLVLTLQRDLSLPKSALELLRISDRLWAICGRLKDIGMPKALLSSIMTKHLTILTIVEQVFGRQEWVLRDLWVCATDHLDLHWHDPWAARVRAARIAACGLHSLHPSDFSRAIHLHYDWLEDHGSHYFPAENREDGVLLESQNLLQDCLLHKTSVVYAQEMLRLVSACRDIKGSSRCRIIWDDFLYFEVRNIWRDMLRDDASTRDDAIAIITHPAFTEACSALTLIQEDEVGEALHFISDFLRPFLASRPSRIRPAFANGILANWVCGWVEDKTIFKVAKEAQALQLHNAKFGEVEALRLYLEVGHLVWDQLSDDNPPWSDAHATIKVVVELLHTFPPSKTYDWVHDEYAESSLNRFLEHVQYGLDGRQNTGGALSLAIDFMHSFRQFVAIPFIIDADEFLQLMIKVSATQRRLGDFRASLATSCDTVKLSTSLQEQGRLGNTKKTCFRALICYARCLLDDAANHATEVGDILRRAWRMTSWWNHDSYLPRRFAIEFPSCLKYIPIRVLDEAKTLFMKPRDKAYDQVIPTWLHGAFIPQESFQDVGNDDLAWGLLLQAIHSIPTSSERALECAKRSLELMEAYQDKRDKMDGPYEASILASVHGHNYILAIIIGDVEKGKIFLDKTISLYRGVFNTEPRMASLPLLELVKLLLKLADKIYFPHVVIPRLQMWKKEIYRGSLSFFEELVELLHDIPYVIV